MECFGPAMSEFKYACPVCGQHMMCDSSQGGSVMECPTCFQKIVAPQAPAPDSKFILTGSKYVEKKITASATEAGALPKPSGGQHLPIWMFLLILSLLVGAGLYVFDRNLFDSAADRAWKAIDVGPVGASGAYNRTGHRFDVSGSGADTWRTADGFYYIHQPVTGNATMTAHVLAMEDTDLWAKAGVMFRESTNADSIFALAAMRPDGQVQFVWRKTTGGEAASSELAGGLGHPKWVKLVRNGDAFTAYCKVKAGDPWMQVSGPQTIKMARQVQVGIIVCAHKAGTLCQAQFDSVALQVGKIGGNP